MRKTPPINDYIIIFKFIMYFKPCKINVEYSFTQHETLRRAQLS